MATAVIMPRQGQSVESCIITTWSKKVGDPVQEGDILFSYETDKSSFDEPAQVSGTLLAILKEEGDEVPCLENVCIIGEAGEDISALVGAKAPEKAEEAPAVEEKSAPAAEAPAVSTVPVGASSGELKISPRARHLAEKTGADVAQATASGPDGRVIERDIQAVLDAGLIKKEEKPKAEDVTVKEAPAAATTATAEAPEYEDVKLSNIRKVIAKSMHASLAEAAQLTLNASFDATKIMAYRASLKAAGEAMGLTNITLNDIVMYAVAKTLKDYPDLNAHFFDDHMRIFKDVHLGVAVDTERGLMVPTIRKANTLSLNELAVTAKGLIREAQSGKISPDKLQGGSFTVTNLGSMGIESFTPVINPPQTAILGVCTITRRLKQVNGVDVSYPAMGLSLTIDHRAVDGAPAARFLKALCTNLENFDLLLAQ
jgi:pyruvate dehydrogenase E2 component (dihydrolipoamide acetyltransferase)